MLHTRILMRRKRLSGNVCFGLACQNQLNTYVPVVIFVKNTISTNTTTTQSSSNVSLGQGWIIGSNNFLIISDYYSRYPVVKKLLLLSASATISATKEAFSILNTPREIMSDNGPQFHREYNELGEQLSYYKQSSVSKIKWIH